MMAREQAPEEMSTETDLIVELVRAANEIERLDAYQRRRLLAQSVATIREMRTQTGIEPSRTAEDMVIDLQVLAVRIERETDEKVRSGLLNAAEAIRTLRILLDAKSGG